MHLDSDDLLARIRQDFPVEFELSQLRLLVDRQAGEIDRLTALGQPVYSSATPRPFLGDPEAAHG